MPTCPVCKSESPRFAWQYQHYSIFECLHCKVQFVDPMQGALLDYYQSRYDQVLASTLRDDIHPGFRYSVREITRAAQRYLTPEQRKAIDVGCGPGYLLSELSRLGFDCLGIDFNPEAIRVAVEHYHVQAQVAQVEDLIALNSRFDLALLIHVLEHVEAPMTLLANIRQILNPGGILIVDLPNRNRFAVNRSLRKGDLGWGEYPPHHLTFWSTAALASVLRLAGYTVLECHPRPFSEEQQAEFFLINRLHLPAGWLTRALAQTMRTLGRLVGLQGETIFAIAQKHNL